MRRRDNCVVLLLGVLALAMPAGCPPAADLNTAREAVPIEETCLSPQETFEKTVPATYLVMLQFEQDAQEPGASLALPIATAFAIREQLLATNAHVAQALLAYSQQRVRPLVIQAGTGRVVQIAGILIHPQYSGDPLQSPDVALLVSMEKLPATIPLAEADNDKDFVVGDTLCLSGFPGDVLDYIPTDLLSTVPQATSLTGTVAALRSFNPTVMVIPELVDVIQHQVPTSPGMSGSPLLHCGCVVAVNNAGTHSLSVVVTDGQLGLEIEPVASNNFGIHVKHLRALLDSLDSGVARETATCAEPWGAAALRTELLDLINAARSASGVEPLLANEPLDSEGDAFACEMISYGFFGLENPVTGETVADRVGRSVFRGVKNAECYSREKETPAQVVDGWMENEETKAILLDPAFRDAGVGLCISSDHGIYWTLELRGRSGGTESGPIY